MCWSEIVIVLQGSVNRVITVDHGWMKDFYLLYWLFEKKEFVLSTELLVPVDYGCVIGGYCL